MTKPFYLLLAIHNHQPVGNFGGVFAQAFEQCYWPIVRLIEEYPHVKAALHHSGPLIDWALEHEKEYVPTIERLVARGQVEIMGGGYYEPILPILRPTDARGQIEMMQKFWESRTGKKPQGMWLAERVWEPSLARLIADAGLRYTILDDEHFRYAGVPHPMLFNYYRTERAGRSVAIFPTDKMMRYLIPFKPVEDVIEHLLKLRNAHPGCAITYGDDGEKFGMWPGTYEWVIQKGWLKKFFEALTEQRDKIVTAHFSDFLKERAPEDTVYLPTASYNEMLEWAMPAESILKYEEVKKQLEETGLMDSARPFLRGGLWDNFLSKYPESNLIHKKAIYVSRRLDAAQEKKKLPEAQRSVYKAQCNCAYWHGLFGGLYLNYLRHALYENLIDAENRIDEVLHGVGPFVRLEKADVDGDGHDEIVMANDRLLTTVAPSQGGSLVELSWRPSRLNLQNTLARRFEAYHVATRKPAHHEGRDIPSIHDIAKSIDEKTGELIYDDFPRFTFLEHVLSSSFDTHVSLSRIEKLASFGHELFDVDSASKNNDAATASLSAVIPNPLKEGETLRLAKTYRLKGNDLSVEFDLKGNPVAPFAFATELNLTLLAANDPGRYYMWEGIKPGTVLMSARNRLEDNKELRLVDKAFGFELKISSSDKALWKFEPVETVSQSESSFDRMYQGSNIWIFFTPAWKKNGTAKFSVALSFKQL